MLTINVHECATTNVGHTGSTESVVDVAAIDGDGRVATNGSLVATAIYVTTYFLSLCNSRTQEQYHQYGGNSLHS